LQLAPGGHLGRFIIWTRDAFNRLNAIYGSERRESTTKKGYKLPRNIMTNSDVTRLINSDEVQSKVRAPIKGIRRTIRKKNPLVNLGALVKLNPYALAARRSEVLAERKRAASKAAALDAARAKKAVPVSATDKREAALARTHEPQQRENYLRLVQGEKYEYSETGTDGTKKPSVKLQKSRDPVKAVFPKSEKKKVKKVKKVKEEAKVEAKEEKKASGEAPKKVLKKFGVKPKKERVAPVEGEDGGKKKKGADKKGGEKKDEAAKGEAPKEEAKKGGDKKGKK